MEAYHGEISEAVLSQTRATLLRPRHPDLEAGLALLQRRQVSQPGTNRVTIMTPQQGADMDDTAQAVYEAIYMSRYHRLPPESVSGAFDLRSTQR